MIPRQVLAALGLATAATSLARDVSRETRVEGLAWLPAAGAALGGIAAAAAWCATPLGQTAAALVAAVVLSLGGGRRPAPITILAALASAWALVITPEAGRPAALLVAPMLARWSVVVQCYGGTPAERADGIGALVGRARFREFGWASVTALGGTLGLLEAVGLLVILVAALLTLGVRVAGYARGRGLGASTLDATSALVETSALVLLAWIGILVRAAS